MAAASFVGSGSEMSEPYQPSPVHRQSRRSHSVREAKQPIKVFKFIVFKVLNSHIQGSRLRSASLLLCKHCRERLTHVDTSNLM